MYKSSGKNLQWLGHDHNHTANNKTLIDSFNDNHAAFLAKLRAGVTLRAVVESFSANGLLISFRNGHFKGEAVLEKQMAIFAGDTVLVELLEKNLGRDGKIFLKTKCLKKLSTWHVEIKCTKCAKIFASMEELSKHLEYSCVLVCRHCGESYTSKKEQYHASKACIHGPATSQGRQKKKKKKSGVLFAPLKAKTGA